MLLACLWGIQSGKTKLIKRSPLFLSRAICEEYNPSDSIAIDTSLVTGNANPYLGSKLLSLTIHSLFSGTCFHLLGSAKSTKALALSSPNPNRLLTISPAPFFFHPGFPANGSYSEVHTTKCCISLHVRPGLFVKCSWLVVSGLSIIFLSIIRQSALNVYGIPLFYNTQHVAFVLTILLQADKISMSMKNRYLTRAEFNPPKQFRHLKLASNTRIFHLSF